MFRKSDFEINKVAETRHCLVEVLIVELVQGLAYLLGVHADWLLGLLRYLHHRLLVWVLKCGCRRSHLLLPRLLLHLRLLVILLLIRLLLGVLLLLLGVLLRLWLLIHLLHRNRGLLRY